MSDSSPVQEGEKCNVCRLNTTWIGGEDGFCTSEMCPSNQIVATGAWCTNCEYLEDPEYVDRRLPGVGPADEDYPCLSCGCAKEDHLDVEVRKV